MSENVLFVDDEENILYSVERLFSDKDIRIFKAVNAEKALQIIMKENIAVMVSDHLMPGIKGIELLSKVKEISPDTVRILMTAHADLATAIKAINEGEVFRFVVKPWENDILEGIVQDGINRYRLIRSLKTGDESKLLSLAQTIELKDPYTRGHCDRVAKYALMIAEALMIGEDKKIEIKYGSWLHDCGKIGIPEKILNLERRLDKEEFEIIKKHSGWGADVARQARLADGIVNIILYHHERFDGQGYPTGIKEKDIPLEARIVSVADVYDALVTDRPYRKGHSIENAKGIILSMKETFLDPELVDIFINLIPDKMETEITSVSKEDNTTLR